MSISNNLSFIENSSGAITTGTINAIGSPISFSINNSLAAQIDQSNNLLVNYSTSQGNYKLQVQGDALVGGTFYATSASLGTLFVTNGIIFNTVFAVATASITSITAQSINDQGGLTVQGITTSTNTTDSTGTTSGAVQIAGGVGIGKSVNVAGSMTILGSVVGGGIRTVSTSTPPSNPTVGDVWYFTTNDLIFRYTYDGTNYFWVDITGPYLSSNVGATIGKAAAMSMVFGG